MKKTTLLLIMLISSAHAEITPATQNTPTKRAHQKEHIITNDTDFEITLNALDKSNLPLFTSTIEPKKILDKKFSDHAPAFYAIESIRSLKTDNFLKINKTITLTKDERKKERLELKITGEKVADIAITTTPAPTTSKTQTPATTK